MADDKTTSSIITNRVANLPHLLDWRGACAAIGGEGRIYILCCGNLGTIYREIRLISWDEADLGTFGGPGMGDGEFTWPVGALGVRDVTRAMAAAA